MWDTSFTKMNVTYWRINQLVNNNRHYKTNNINIDNNNNNL